LRGWIQKEDIDAIKQDKTNKYLSKNN